jgi:dTDP-6-deoxy-L-talose 4-dehydrogenase (NAD+)
MVSVNIGLSEKVMRFVSKHGCKLFLNTGSEFEYGSKITNRPINEDDILDPDDIYAATKVGCENILKVYSKLLNVKMVTIRPFSIFGKYESAQRIGPLIVSSCKQNISIELTSGQQVRDYMDVRDVADAIYGLIINSNKLEKNEAINICSGNSISLKQFVLMIADAFGFDIHLLKFGSKPYRQNESMFFVGDNAKLLSKIGNKDYKITKEKIIEGYGDIFNR